ncbi:MAG: hypothetical protein OXT67_06385 [Zetaproteobacteria bacterium]|nr:hypothetical protein [Zetaproteobacteria bacterium]
MSSTNYSVSKLKRLSAQTEVNYIVECTKLVFGKTSETEYHVLKEILTNFSTQTNYSTNQTLISLLTQERHPCLVRLEARFGAFRLIQNLFAITLKLRLIDLSELLNDFSRISIAIGQVGVAQNITFFDDQTDTVVHTHFPQIVWELCRESQLLNEELLKHLHKLNEYLPSVIYSPMCENTATFKEESTLAQALGFKSIQKKLLVTDHSILVKTLATQLSHFQCMCERLIHGVSPYQSGRTDYNTVFELVDQFTHHLNHLFTVFSFQHTKVKDRPISAYEHQRCRILQDLDQVINVFAKMLTEYYQLLRLTHFTQNNHSLRESNTQLTRRFSNDLMQKGVSPQEALTAAGNLVQKMARHDEHPKNFLIAEWQEVHQKFDEQSLQIFQQHLNQTPQQPFNNTKRREFLVNFEQLGKKISSHTDILKHIILLCLYISLGGCGVKTHPTADVIDPRPRVPPLRQDKNPKTTAYKKSYKEEI